MKHRNQIIQAITTTLFSVLFLIQCTQKQSSQEKEKEKIDPAFTGYVSAFTSGVISNQSVIMVRLMDANANAEAGKEIDFNLLSFSPKIKGKTYWIDNRTIEFKPEEMLPQNQSFNAQFQLSKILEVPDKVKTLKFSFATRKQAIDVQYNGNETYDPKDLTWQKLNGSIQFNDYVPEEKLDKVLTATQSGKKLNITWEVDPDGRNPVFYVDSVSRKESRSQVTLTWNGKEIGTNESGETDIEIPPLGDFKVVNTKVTQTPNQLITIYFSDPISPEQEIDGLIHLSNNRRVRLEVKDNIVKVYPATRLTQATQLIVEDGVRNIMNYQLSERYSREIKFSNIKPDVKLIGNGVILPSTDGLIFPFKAVNVNAVNVKIIKIFEKNINQFLQVNQFDGTRELKRVGRIVYRGEVQLNSDNPIDYGSWNTFALDLSEMINAEPGAIYRVSLGFSPEHSLYPCESNNFGDSRSDAQAIEKEEAKYDGPSSNYYYYDDYDDYYYDDYNYNDRKNPCKISYYRRKRSVVSRNVFASDFGLIAKGGNSKELFVAVTDIRTTEPIANVQVEIYNYQDQLLSTATSDANGLIRVNIENKPFLLVAKKDNQVGYLRLDDGSALSLSMFDIGGQKNTKGLKGYLYGERGVWRPGDSLFLTFVLEDKNDILPDDHPVSIELYTPENQLYYKRVKTNPINGVYDFKTATKPEAPTGNWQAIVRVGGAKFTKTLKIETVKPNRLKINLDFGTDIISGRDQLQGTLSVKWLHGAIAKNLASDIEVTLNEGKTKFDDFPGFNFDDPSKSFTSREITVFDGRLDAKGEANISPSFSVGKRAPGMINAAFKIRAFEEGGEFSVDRFTIPYSPFSSYVGIKVPKGKGWNGALFSNEPNIIPIITVSEQGKKVDRKKLKIEIYEIYWRWWWERHEEEDLGRYIANNSSRRIKTEYINTVNGEAKYELKFDRNTWGRKFIKVTDPVSGHSTGKLFYTSYRGWWSDGGQEKPGGAEMLTFSTDKSKYNVGENVQVELPFSKIGRALVSIESGSKVIDAFWVETNKETNKFTFAATEEMAPNVYIHVSYLQPHNQKDNDLPIRMYGVQPISVQDPETHLKPVIAMPDVLEPEGDVTIKVSEEKGKKMTYTLAVVDEGLLDLTRFKTPNAWKSFYSREALGVKTWDMYKYVLGALSGEMAGLLALGGDEEIQKKGGQKANRFKPVVKFIGPIELDASKTNTHTFKMPNYVGSVRVMVVGSDSEGGAYGSAEKATPVKKPLMVLATLPRVLGPTEKVKLPVTVFAMDDEIKNVSVEVETNEFLKIEGAKKKSLQFEQMGDEIVYFDVDVSDKVGIGKVQVTAKSGKEKAVYDIEIDVRLPNPRVTNVIFKTIGSGKTLTSEFQAVGVEGTNNGVIEVSAIPPIDLEKRLYYLIRYPHGCIEQTTSSVFPQLFLENLTELSEAEKNKVQKNIEAGINRIRTFQTGDGGLSYWPGEVNSPSDWGSNYGGHYMLEAKAKGYSLPAGFLDNWIKYQKRRANDWKSSSSGSRHHYYNSSQLIQAYRLYTLALAGKPAMGAMNRMREMNNLSVAAKWRLAAAYYLAGREDVAKKLVQALTIEVKPYKELSYSYGSTERDQAMILETLTYIENAVSAKTLLDIISENMSSDRWYSTQTTAYTLLAISKFVSGSGTSNKLDFEYSLNNSKQTSIKSSTPISQIPLDFSKSNKGEFKIVNNQSSPLFVKIITDGIPLIGDNTNASNDLNMTVKYYNMNGGTIDPTDIKQGTDFMAVVRLHHPGVRRDYKEMALTQIFPSGWEIRNLRMDETSSVHEADVPRYQDIRDDRVYSYFDIRKNSAKTYKVLLNAAYKGKFYMPSVYCEAMYDNEINAQVGGKWVVVSGQDEEPEVIEP